MNDMNEIISEYENVGEAVQKTFGNLSAEQINWKPRADSWSVGQCLDHLIKSNQEFDPQFQAVSSGTKKSSLWEKYSPLTSFFGNFLLKSLKNDAKKFKAPSKAIVPPSDIAADIVEQFVQHQREVVEKIKTLENVDLQKTVVTSPFLKLMTYRLSTALEIGVEHEKRHFRQAERVMQTEGFPK
ncbi:MAG TPA: DinB family protein [Pyrinomonadaceae bacterium]|nr:DinB family protein [Pyrinomonadaceae bacterium]